MDTVTAGDAEIPTLGLGTYPLSGDECAVTVERALELGYRHVDTAENYGNEAAVGRGIEAASVPREDVFVTTKVWQTNLERPDLLRSARASLDRLGVETVDLLLIHSPNQSVPVRETIRAMNDLQAEGLVEHIGVSNFSVSQLRDAMAASETPVVTNQVRYHPYEDQLDILSFCIEHDVVLTAYSPLAKGKVLDDETLEAIGDRHDKSAAQVALRWLLQKEQVAAIPKASSPDHLRANRDVFDFSLNDAETERIFELEEGLVGRVRSELGL